MTSLVQVALTVQRFLEKKGWPFCFIGGLAVQHWGEPRLTRGVDLMMFTGFGSESSVIKALLSEFPARISDAETFATEHRVILLNSLGGIGIDISLGGFPFEEEATKRSVMVQLATDISLRLCSAEDLIVYKAFAARDQDWRDVRAIIIRQGAALDWEYILPHINLLADLKEELQIVTTLQALRQELL